MEGIYGAVFSRGQWAGDIGQVNADEVGGREEEELGVAEVDSSLGPESSRKGCGVGGLGESPPLRLGIRNVRVVAWMPSGTEGHHRHS